MILAAGASRRFGRSNKLLAPFRGKALVLHAADALHMASVNKLLAVTSDPQVTALLPEFHHIPGEKLLSQNIAHGAAWAKSQGAERLLVVLGDMPFVTSAHCDQLIERCSDTSASASSSGGVRSPPTCFPSARFDNLIALTGDRGAKALINAIPSQNIIDASSGELLDIDTKAEFEALKEQLP
jgi:molybdenum cofactor cytidylyltransferase